MTLIIGFKCKEGVALVSDTKIMDVSTGEEFWASKILTPIENTPFAVGAAGYTHLFREFNRKLPEVVAKSINKIRIDNVAELIKTGLTRTEAISYLYSQELKVSQTQKQEIEQPETKHPSNNENITPIDLPNSYSAEKFIDDCKLLIKTVSSEVEDDDEPIDVLIGLKRANSDQPELHYIGSDGNAEEIDEYGQIGSGSPFVKMFFDELYDHEKSLDELITYAFRAISFVQNVAKESSVGYNQEHPPEAVIVLNDGRYGRLTFKNEDEFFKEIEKETNDYKDIASKSRVVLEGII